MSAISSDQNDKYFELAIYQPHLNFYPSPLLKIPPEDLSYWRKIADKGSTEFQLKVARFYEDFGDPSFALYYYGLAAPMVRHHKHCIQIGRFIERLVGHSLGEAINHLQHAKTQNNPLAFYVLAQCYFMLLVSPESLLTPVHAQMLKDLLIEKQSLGIAFGNEDDATTLTDAFLKDSSLILDEKSLIGVPKYLDNCGEIFFFKINPDYPVKKK